MPKLVVTIDSDAYEMMENAAKFHGLPISLWARTVLLKEARAVKHRILCQPKAPADDAPMTPEQILTKKNYEKRLKEVDNMELY